MQGKELRGGKEERASSIAQMYKVTTKGECKWARRARRKGRARGSVKEERARRGVYGVHAVHGGKGTEGITKLRASFSCQLVRVARVVMQVLTFAATLFPYLMRKLHLPLLLTLFPLHALRTPAEHSTKSTNKPTHLPRPETFYLTKFDLRVIDFVISN